MFNVIKLVKWKINIFLILNKVGEICSKSNFDKFVEVIVGIIWINLCFNFFFI